jgi:glycosyltransferase involved in cell wall biosynthesis
MPISVCLNMIVRDEAAIIERCLAAVRPFIDYWVIVDTGSVDDTPERIESALAGIPGEVHRRPWKNFGHNRTEALNLARDHGDYLLFIDADETLRAPDDFVWPALTDDAYYLNAEYGATLYSRCSLVSTRLEWKWSGVLHEFLESTPQAHIGHLDWPRIVVQHDGARARDPKTYEKDAAILERALLEDPLNARNAFYLAQSWRDAGDPVKALAAYRHRVTMAGFEEEIWYALFEIAKLTEQLGGSPAEVRSAYLDAYQRRPSRAEPLYKLAHYHRARNELALAYLFAKQAAAIPRPNDLLFIDEGVYTWCCLDELATAAYWVGAYDEGRKATERMLAEGHVPASHRARIETNLGHFLERQNE